MIFSAAPALESLGLYFRDDELSLSRAKIPRRLASVDVSCTFGIRNGRVVPSGANDVWTRVWTTLRAATVLPIRRITVKYHIFFFRSVAGCSQEDLYADYTAMLSQITEWQTAVNVLDGFPRLESITFEVRSTLLQSGVPMVSVHVHEGYVTAMREAVTKNLPRRYGDILHVKATVSESNV
ncbi:hypothetical protein PsYK624_157520 [Phanerochaete sordida]|uniref:Uncharacterized protein n=1 Tax=Phanerochaete sordida TaxID=48140 RepID=A0A9P3GR11_9APHY|nr:hypothetical protein PsYK624_157520 [Phanerochaete sordida]